MVTKQELRLVAIFIFTVIKTASAFHTVIAMCSKTEKNNNLPHVPPAVFAAMLFISSNVHALEVLSEQEMGAVQGRDGVTIGLEVPQGGAITAEQIRWEVDNGEVDANSNSLQNHLIIGGTAVDANQFVIKPIDLDGTAASQALDFALAIDSYTNNEGRSGLGLDATWNRMRVQMDSLSVTDTSRSFGAVALDAGGRFAVFGDGGFANSSLSADQARVIVNVGDIDNTDPDPNTWTMGQPGRLFYRMGPAGSTEVQLDNFGFLFDMHQGTVGVNSDGIVVSSAPGSRTDLNLTFDVFANVANGASTAFQFNEQSIPMLLFGWRGGIEDFDLQLRPQGAWLPDDGTFTQGLTASLGFDLADNFQFVLGEARYEDSGDEGQSYLEFTQPISMPTTLGQNRKDLEFGYLTLDTVSAAHQSVGGICFGGANTYGSTPSACASSTGGVLPTELLDVAPSDTGLAIINREWGLHAYSSKVVYRDGVSAANNIDEGWALIYTLGDISTNWYLYPQSGDGATPGSPGFTMDVVAAIQTEGGADANGRPDRSRWENGTHLMIGDTDFQTSYHDPSNPTADGLAIGLMGADLLFATNDMGVGVSLGDGLNLSSNEVRLQLRGMFGGGDVPRMESPVYGSYIDMNLEMDEFVFKIFPSLNGDAINFGGFLSLANLNNGFSNDTGSGHGHDDGTYISFAEPNLNKLNVDVRLADITGDIEIPSNFILAGGGGKIDLLSASGEADGKPKLRIENNLNIGALATKPGGGAGDPLEIGRIEFGGKDLGSMIIPAAKVYTSLTLEQQ
ncbi:DUF6160 family protein [Alcanivorax sp. DG881]|jgi:hypothetical protein|uniref:DUF6160 family protein n=1 Tax=Alcanivorax sp. DG881 TaxID=236097 RepID=UPI001E339E14|nr:DUF6160 family protein [Alcanivorax sp. DG881]